MKKLLLTISFILLSPALAFAGAPDFVQNDSLASTPNSNNGYPGSASVDARGRVIGGGWLTAPALLTYSCSTAATTTANTQIVSNQGAGTRIYVHSLSCSNTSATASEIQFKDGTTARVYGGIGTQAATGGDWQKDFTVPWRLSQNSALQFAMTTTLTSTTCCAAYWVLTE